MTHPDANDPLVHQREKLAQLGTLAAGLAHELNNPAGAARSAAGQLCLILRKLGELTLDMHALKLSPAQIETLRRLHHEVMDAAGRPPQVGSSAQAALEDDLARWLESRGIGDAWQIAPDLIAFTPQRLADVAREFPGALPVVLAWLAGQAAAEALARQGERSATRIIELAGAIKRYAFADHAPLAELDIHQGLEDTLLMLQYKLRRRVTVEREFDRTMPLIRGSASELSQVWTNLIDNAIDAMHEQPDGQGRLLVRTARLPDAVEVEIRDNGPGIAPEVLPSIFEPFFTTKPSGKGTGLGLSIAQRIIVQHHGGQIAVKSQPGCSSFVVRLPSRRGA